MASRPWVTPQEVKDYSEIKAVQQRTDARLRIDISRAEQYVISYTHNDFSEYTTIPSAVKNAVILLAENYAHAAVMSSKQEKSETFDDYSYTTFSSADISADIGNLGLDLLLDEYVKVKPEGNVTMRMTVL